MLGAAFSCRDREKGRQCCRGRAKERKDVLDGIWLACRREARPAGFSPFGPAATADAGAAADRSIPRDPTSIEEGLRLEAPRFDFEIQG
jgi:hypothetical protein